MNKFLKMKYHHKKELNNVLRSETKSPPFITEESHPEVVKNLQPVTTTKPFHAKRLKQLKVTNELFAL